MVSAVINYFLVLFFKCPCSLSRGLNVVSFFLGISGYKRKRKGSRSPTFKTKANENVCKDHTAIEVKSLKSNGDQTAVAQVLLNIKYVSVVIHVTTWFISYAWDACII